MGSRGSLLDDLDLDGAKFFSIFSKRFITEVMTRCKRAWFSVKTWEVWLVNERNKQHVFLVFVTNQHQHAETKAIYRHCETRVVYLFISGFHMFSLTTQFKQPPGPNFLRDPGGLLLPQSVRPYLGAKRQAEQPNARTKGMGQNRARQENKNSLCLPKSSNIKVNFMGNPQES